MGLQDFLAAVQTQMTTVMTGLSQTVPVFKTGSDHLQDEDAPPRIVFVPTRERIAGPHGQGGDTVANPRPLATAHLHLECHVWGDDIPTVETLRNHLVAAIHSQAYGAHAEVSGDWSIGQSSATRKGWVYVLETTIEIPITRELDLYATINTMPITAQVLPIP